MAETPDAVTKETLACIDCGKNYKVIPQELSFLRKSGIRLPRHCPFCRQASRMQLRNPRKLWARTCAKCSEDIQTTYAPDRPETVYCERCYLETVY